MYQFHQAIKAGVQKSDAPKALAELVPPAPPPPEATGQAIINNLLVHIPTEAVTLATTLSPLVLDSNQTPSPARAWILFVGALLATILVRWLNKATVAVWVTTSIAFVLWMSLIPNGAPALQFSWIRTNSIPLLMIALIVSTMVAILGVSGKLK